MDKLCSVSDDQIPSSTAAINSSVSGNPSASSQLRTSWRSSGVSFGSSSRICLRLIVLSETINLFHDCQHCRSLASSNFPAAAATLTPSSYGSLRAGNARLVLASRPIQVRGDDPKSWSESFPFPFCVFSVFRGLKYTPTRRNAGTPIRSPCRYASASLVYSTVTLLARLRGLSTSQPNFTARW
jgi:hypothetical protein